MSESGGGLELISARMGAWRRRHKTREVLRYQVIFDGATIADIEARSSQGLDDELACAAWELAQGLTRPVTVDVIAVGPADVEIARTAMRVLPERQTAPVGGDLAAVVSAFASAHRQMLEQNAQLTKLVIDTVGAVTAQMRVVGEITTSLARATAARAEAAEADRDKATELLSDAVQLADGGERRTLRERGEDIIEGVIRKGLGLDAGPSSSNDAAAE